MRCLPKPVWAALDSALFDSGSNGDFFGDIAAYLERDLIIRRDCEDDAGYLTLFNGISLLVPFGVPLLDALLLVGAENPAMVPASRKIADKIRAGESYSEAFSDPAPPLKLPAFVVESIRIGEKTGTLAVMLPKLIDQLMVEKIGANAIIPPADGETR
jgi:hypothetical protein